MAKVTSLDGQVWNCFLMFCPGEKSWRDEARPRCLQQLDQDALRGLVEYNQLKGTRELALHLKISQSSVHCCIKKVGKMSQLGLWVPHTLREKNTGDRISLATRQRMYLVLKNIITGNEKWIFYDKVQFKRQWFEMDDVPQPALKVKLRKRKVRLCVWWDHDGIIHFEFLNRIQTQLCFNLRLKILENALHLSI